MSCCKSIQIVANAICIDPILSVVIDRSEITSKLKVCDGRFFNYVLVENDTIKYIGYTAGLHGRLTQHKTRPFDKVLIVEFSEERVARENEKGMIIKIKPKSNYQYC